MIKGDYPTVAYARLHAEQQEPVREEKAVSATVDTESIYNVIWFT